MIFCHGLKLEAPDGKQRITDCANTEALFRIILEKHYDVGVLMKIHRIASPETTLDFDAAIRRASEVADEQLGENMLLSWYDRERDLESPPHASACHEGCAIKGFGDYALNSGGALVVFIT